MSVRRIQNNLWKEGSDWWKGKQVRILYELVTVFCKQKLQIHWENREGSRCVRAISRETCLSQYRNEKVQATRNWQYEMDHRTVCGIIQFYFRCLRFLTEAFFGYIFGRSWRRPSFFVSRALTIGKSGGKRNEKETGSCIIISSYVCSSTWRMWFLSR